MSKRNKSRKSNLELDKLRRELRFTGKRTCSRCKVTKETNQFSIEYESTLSSWCKKCHRLFSIEYRKNPGEKERQKLYKREYRKRKRQEAKELKKNS